MADPFGIKLNEAKLAHALIRMPDRLAAEMKSGWEAAKNNFDSRFIQERLNGRPGLIRRTGRLSNSFVGQVTGRTLGQLRVIYGTNVEYAPIHEFGGTIKPKKGKYLRFPTEAGGFAFVKQVTIPRRLEMFKTWDDSVEQFGGLIDHSNAAIERTLNSL